MGEREPRHRLTPAQERMIDEYLSTKGPRECAMKGPDCSGILTRDHIDGNRNNNSLFNFRYLCIGHQNKERSRLAKLGRAVESAKESEKERTGAVDGIDRESSREVETSMEWRPRFQAYVAGLILHAKKDSPVTSAYVVRNGAQWIRNKTNGKKGSKVTCKRWLEELTSDEGPFELYELEKFGQCVRFRWDEKANGPAPWEIVMTRAEA